MKINFYSKFLVSVILLSGFLSANAQDPARFKDQVKELVQKEYNFSKDKKLVVFAGSSSIRMWKDVQSYFPGYNVINNGFGGSQFSDLLYYCDQLVKNPAPDILFIYEGDNDIAGNKKPGLVLKQAKELAKKIQYDLPKAEIIFISPKPSIARESLKKKYTKLNKRLGRYCNRTKGVEFADVWYPMLDNSGRVFQDIFLEDGLHMNKKGYDIWGKVIGGFLE